MKNLKDVMALLNIGMEEARKVLNKMACNGIDFSECSKRTFAKEAKTAYAELTA